MSYGGERHRGGRRRYREDDRREAVVESPQDRLRNAIIKLGEVDPIAEITQLEEHIRTSPVALPHVAEAFRFAITEQPFKIPYYVAVINALHNTTDDAPSMGSQILEDFWKGFQAYLDKLAWRDMRACIHFFAHLAVAKLVSPDSFIALLQAFTAVPEEFGVSSGRATQACLCAGEGLMIAGATVAEHSPSAVTEIIAAIEAYNESTASPRWLVQPMMKLFVVSERTDNVDELLDSLLLSVKTLAADNFVEEHETFVRPYLQAPTTASPFIIPSVLVPPEVIELDGLTSESPDDVQVKKDEWPILFLRLFDNSVTPNPNTPGGYAIRSALLSIIDIFEVNRKECARLLLEYPKWIQQGTFKPKPGAPTDVEPIPGKDWQLESTVIEIVLGVFLLLPESSKKSVYYVGLITELCKLSPSTVGPAVGKSIRKLYTGLSDGLDVEVSRRFAEWFATHMSNFGFQWVWKEWIPDLSLTVDHPRRAFMRRALEFEIRLSYYDRISKTLPEVMQAPDAHALPEQAPTPNFEYEDPAKPHHDAAQSILNLLRGRATSEEVISQIDNLRVALEASEVLDMNIDATLRYIAIQSILNIGSRSFSHLLNAIERYLPFLRYVASGWVSSTTGSGNAEARLDILTASALFWKDNPQMVGIVFDKMMQYQIVDPTDVVEWTFSTRGRHAGESKQLRAFEWDLLKAALDKANGRVMIARRKLGALRKEDDETRARTKATEMEVDGEDRVKPEAAADAEAENPALATGIKASASLNKEQKATLARALDGFVACLATTPESTNPNPQARAVVSEQAWQDRANWGDDEWTAWETWSWYRHFCRVYAPYLRGYATSLSTVSFSKLQGESDEAGALIQKIFAIATGDYS